MFTPPRALDIVAPSCLLSLKAGDLAGSTIQEIRRTLGDLEGVFADESARAALPGDRLAYRVQCHYPVADGTAGGLFFGTSYLEPGRVGDEYFMTKGHHHAARDRGEYYWCYQGEGVLVLMDGNRRTWGERVTPGSVHYIHGEVAHRLVNTGDTTLAVGACWPSDAGHDYESIADVGFSARLFEVDGKPRLIEVD